MKKILKLLLPCSVVFTAITAVVPHGVSAIPNLPRRVQIFPLGTSITAACVTCPSHRYYLWKTLVDAGFADRIDFVGANCGVGDPYAVDPPPPGPCGVPLYRTYNGCEWDWDHNGIHGATLSFVLNRFYDLTRLGTYIPDISCIEMGTNDIRSSINPDTITRRMEHLIDSLRSYNPSMYIMIGLVIPSTKIHRSSVIALNEKYKELALAKTTPQSPVSIVDQFTEFDTLTMLEDGIHTNIAGQIFMGRVWSDSLLSILSGNFNGPPVVTLEEAPPDGSSLEAGVPVHLSASAECFAGIASIDFYFNGALAGKGLREGDVFTCTWTPVTEETGDLYAEAVDFFGAVASSGPVEITVTPGAILDRTIMEIQGAGYESPVAGRRVRTTGVMTLATVDSATFWMQDAAGDGNPSTSDGIAVDFSSFSDKSSLPRQQDLVRVVGIVQEFRTDSRDEPVTRITRLDSVIVLSHSNPFPAVFHTTDLPGTPFSVSYLKERFEQLEGMIFRITSAVVTGPTDLQGRFSVALSGNRITGSSFFPAPEGPSFITLPWPGGSVDYNPECLLVGTSTLPDRPLFQPGDTIHWSYGILDYADGHYLLQPSPAHTSRSAVRPLPSPPVGGGSVLPNPSTIRVVSVNLGALCDTLNATGRNDSVFSPAQLELKLVKIAKAFSEELKLPEIVCLHGIETEALMTTLAKRLNSAASGRYKVFKREALSSTDPIIGGLNPPTGVSCGLLYDSTRCYVGYHYQLHGNGFDATGYEPMVNEFYIIGSGSWRVITFSLVEREQDDDPLFGIHEPPERPSEALRSQQAATIRQYIDSLLTVDPDARVVLAGLYDDLPFNEGGESSCAMSIVKGSTDEPVLASVADVYYHVPWKLYTTLYDGRFEMTSNIMVSPALFADAKTVRIHHFNAGFDRAYADSSSTAVRAFADDPVEVEFRISN